MNYFLSLIFITSYFLIFFVCFGVDRCLICTREFQFLIQFLVLKAEMKRNFYEIQKKQAENKTKNFFYHLSNSIKVIASHAVWRMILIRSLIKVCHKIGNTVLKCDTNNNKDISRQELTTSVSSRR